MQQTHTKSAQLCWYIAKPTAVRLLYRTHSCKISCFWTKSLTHQRHHITRAHCSNLTQAVKIKFLCYYFCKFSYRFVFVLGLFKVCHKCNGSYTKCDLVNRKKTAILSCMLYLDIPLSPWEAGLLFWRLCARHCFPSNFLVERTDKIYAYCCLACCGSKTQYKHHQNSQTLQQQKRR